VFVDVGVRVGAGRILVAVGRLSIVAVMEAGRVTVEFGRGGMVADKA
jgi:hypothetical protein